MAANEYSYGELVFINSMINSSMSLKTIAEKIGRTEEGLRAKLYHTDISVIIKKTEQRKQRRCLTHGGMFMSDGPHNRICPTCTNSNRKPERCGGLTESRLHL